MPLSGEPALAPVDKRPAGVLGGHAVWISIEHCRLKIGAWNGWRSVDPGMGLTHRFGRFISQLCPHMSIAAMAGYTSLAWRTVKALTGLGCLGVDEIARAMDQVRHAEFKRA